MKDIALLQRHLEEYRCTSADEEMNAIREMLQEMVLAGLSRTDFFVKAAFHGGTQLRIFEGVRRFSEDLDFVLVSQDLSFSLLSYLEKVSEELSAVGVTMEVRDKSKVSTTVTKGFLKNDSLVKILDLRFVGGRGTPGTPPKSRSRSRSIPTRPAVRHIARFRSCSRSRHRLVHSTAKVHSRARCTLFCAVRT